MLKNLQILQITNNFFLDTVNYRLYFIQLSEYLNYKHQEKAKAHTKPDKPLYFAAKTTHSSEDH